LKNISLKQKGGAQQGLSQRRLSNNLNINVEPPVLIKNDALDQTVHLTKFDISATSADESGKLRQVLPHGLNEQSNSQPKI